MGGEQTYVNSKFNINININFVLEALDRGENYLTAFKEYWEVLRKEVEEKDRKIEEEYNKLIEMWSKSKPSDIIKFNFE